MRGSKTLSSRKCDGSAGDSENGVAALSSPAAKIPAILDGGDDEEEEVVGVQEEMVEEMMRWLEREISAPPAFPPAIGPNQETCGPSISDSASTVMASIDTRAVGGCVPYFFSATPGPEFPPGVSAWNVIPAGIQGVQDPSADGGDGAGDEGTGLAPAMSAF